MAVVSQRCAGGDGARGSGEWRWPHSGALVATVLQRSAGRQPHGEGEGSALGTVRRRRRHWAKRRGGAGVGPLGVVRVHVRRATWQRLGRGGAV